jgi:hypothetical protein
MGFKEDADFARFVSMGAVGTAAVATHLREQHGHRPIELERYAMANKVWQTKVKRLRLPDLVCVRCGRRVESRAKSSLGIILSHSDTPGREWDAGGMRDDDLYAFLRTDLANFPPYAGSPAFFTAGALRAAIHQAKRSAPKAASQGSEITLTWPTWVPARSGRFVGIDGEGRILCSWNDGGSSRYWQWRKWTEPKFIYLEPGGPIVAAETIVAGVVEPPAGIGCPGNTWHLAGAMGSDDSAERYAAVKAAGIVGRGDLQAMLVVVAHDDSEDWRIRLEALASLSRLEPAVWTGRIATIATSEDSLPEQQIEAVFVLGEIPSPEAGDTLEAIAAAEEDLPQELRAAAAWGLGQGVSPRPELLLPLTIDEDAFVALHAITAIDQLPDGLLPTLLQWLDEGDDHRAAVAAQLLQRHQRVHSLLDACENHGRSRMWALRALGDLPPQLVRRMAGNRLTPEIEMVLQPIWLGQRDWLRTEGKEGLEALDIQKVRFDPASPG